MTSRNRSVSLVLVFPHLSERQMDILLSGDFKDCDSFFFYGNLDLTSNKTKWIIIVMLHPAI